MSLSSERELVSLPYTRSHPDEGLLVPTATAEMLFELKVEPSFVNGRAGRIAEDVQRIVSSGRVITFRGPEMPKPGDVVELWELAVARESDTRATEEQRLREKLWFPDLVDQLLAQAQSILPAGRTITEKRRIDGFLKPAIELQEEAGDKRELLQYALNQTLRQRICAGPQNRHWFHYPRAIVRNRKHVCGKPAAAVLDNVQFMNVVLAEVPPSRLFRELGCAGTETMVSCPFHEDGNPSLKIVETSPGEKAAWRCYSCERGGSAIDAVQMLFLPERYLTPLDAAIWLNRHFGLGIPEDDWRPGIDEMVDALEHAWETRQGSHPAVRAVAQMLADHGLTEDTVTHFGLYADTSTGRLVIPLRENGHVVATARRALFAGTTCSRCGEPHTAKQMSERLSRRERGCPACGDPNVNWIGRQHPLFLSEVGFSNSGFVYNLDGAVAALKTGEFDALYVVDGYSDCWVAVEGGYKATVATAGMMTEEKSAKIARAATAVGRVVVVPDFDAVGLIASGRTIALLRQANPELEILVAAQCPESWARDAGYENGAGPTDLGRAAIELTAEQAVAPLEHTVHWSIWKLRLILDRNGKPLDANMLNAEKDKVSQLIGDLGNDVRRIDAYPSIRDILIREWADMMPASEVESWFSFVASAAAADGEMTVAGGAQAHMWIERHGSKVLQHGMRRGYDVSEMYARERAAAEFGEDAQVFPPGSGINQQLKKRNHPTEAEIARELQVLESGVVDERQVRIVYFEQWAQAAVAIHDWAGRFTVLVPTHPAANAATV